MIKYLFVGLGNPGLRYQNTRHNLGLMALRAWTDRQKEAGAQVSDWQEDKQVMSQLARVTVDGKIDVVCLWPMTGMNNSGRAVAEYLKYHPLDTTNILIVHDDLELPSGDVKIKEGGSAAGHNGVRSIQDVLSETEMPRLRLGIGRPPGASDVSDYVLQEFIPEEEPAVKKMITQACELLTTRLTAAGSK